VPPRVVELIEHVRADAARAPLAVVGLRGPGPLNGHIVWMDLGRDGVEENPAFAVNGRRADSPGKEPLCEGLDDRTTNLRTSLLAALRDREGRRQDRLGALALG